MSISIKIEPKEFQSTYNEVMIVLDSTNKSQDKFQYVVDVNIEGVTSSRLKIQSNPQGFGVLNIAKHLQSSISSVFESEDRAVFKRIQDSYLKYDVTLSEEYVLISSFTSVGSYVIGSVLFSEYGYSSPHNYEIGDFINVSGSTVGSYDGIQEVTVVTSTTSVVTSKVFTSTATGQSILSNGVTTIIPTATVFTGNKFVTNNVVDWVDVPNWDNSDYEMSTTTPGKFLTNLPLEFSSTLTDRFTLNLRNKTTDNARYMKVVSNRGTFYFDNAFNTNAATTEFLSMAVGMYDITNATLSVTPTQDVLPVFDNDTTSYTVCTTDALLDTTSEVRTFKVDRLTTQHENYKLIYLNEGGSYSCFNFSAASSKSVRVRKKNFTQNYGSYNVNENTYGYESQDRGIKRISTEVDETFKLNSNWITEVVGNTIEDLIVSPEVYHIKDSTYKTGDTPYTVVQVLVNGFNELLLNFGAPHGLVAGERLSINTGAFSGFYNILSVPNSGAVVICAPTNNLFFTPSVINNVILDSDGLIRAVEVLTSSVSVKQAATNKVINYSLEMEYSVKNITQR